MFTDKTGYNTPRITRSGVCYIFQLLFILMLAACQPAPASLSPTKGNTPFSRPSATQTPLPHTPTPTLTDAPASPTSTSLPPTATITPAPSPTVTPTFLPPTGFTTDTLRAGFIPQTYITDTCRYLRLRWDPTGSLPGTVVVPIMFHSIVKDNTKINDNKDIPAKFFLQFVSYAHFLGFKTITTPQLLDFLENNVRIPPRSMILIFDDRREGVIREHIMPIWEALDWRVTMAFISGPVVTAKEWKEMEKLFATGRVDVQAHGYLHNAETYIQDSTPEDVIRQEIYGPIQALEKHFGYRPIAFIWPGGNYNALGVQIAREAGYKLGFTIDSSTPLLFNWIPLGEPERSIHDPLMVLPRAWSHDAPLKLYRATQIADQARLFAMQNYAQEAAWYQSTCRGELPPLPEEMLATPTH